MTQQMTAAGDGDLHGLLLFVCDWAGSAVRKSRGSLARARGWTGAPDGTGPQSVLMSVDVVSGAAKALGALGEPLRWRIVELLAGEELCVCHLVEELGVAQPLVSHHLRVLREAGLVETERYRYWTYYRLQPEALAHLADRLSSLVGEPARERRPCC
jgi:ArsR family transcriptional regulator